VLQRVAACCSALQCGMSRVSSVYGVLQCAVVCLFAVCTAVCVYGAVCCRALQCAVEVVSLSHVS